jgi:hypothetical protein
MINAASRRRPESLSARRSREFGEVGPDELPLERLGEELVVGLEGEAGEFIERGDIGRREDYALEDAEVDLDLVPPGRVDGEMHGHEARVGLGEPSDHAPPVADRWSILQRRAHTSPYVR